MGGGFGLSELAGGLAGRRAGRLAASRVFLRVHVCVRGSLTSFFGRLTLISDARRVDWIGRGERQSGGGESSA